VSSSIVGLHRSGATIRSKPAERSSTRPTTTRPATDPAHRARRARARSSRRALPSVELPHVHDCGHAPVDRRWPTPRKQLMCRSRRATGHQFAVM
jgi:hypothetical protein